MDRKTLEIDENAVLANAYTASCKGLEFQLLDTYHRAIFKNNRLHRSYVNIALDYFLQYEIEYGNAADAKMYSLLDTIKDMVKNQNI